VESRRLPGPHSRHSAMKTPSLQGARHISWPQLERRAPTSPHGCRSRRSHQVRWPSTRKPSRTWKRYTLRSSGAGAGERQLPLSEDELRYLPTMPMPKSSSSTKIRRPARKSWAIAADQGDTRVSEAPRPPCRVSRLTTRRSSRLSAGTRYAHGEDMMFLYTAAPPNAERSHVAPATTSTTASRRRARSGARGHALLRNT